MVARESNSGMVKSDQKLLDIIEIVSKHDEMGISQIANELDLTKSSVHKHLKTLEANEFVVNNNGRYRLGLRFLTLGGRARRNNELYQIAAQKVTECAEDAEGTVTFSTLEHGKGVFVLLFKPVTGMIPIGKRFYLHENAAGKAMLAKLPDEKIDEIIDRHGLPPSTDNTISNRESLMKRIETIQKRGYALNMEERRVGIRAISVAIEHPESGSYGALSISGPANRLTEKNLHGQYADTALVYANEIENLIRYV